MSLAVAISVFPGPHLDRALGFDPADPLAADWVSDVAVAAHPTPPGGSPQAPQDVVQVGDVLAVPGGDEVDRFNALDGSALSSFTAPSGVFISGVAMSSGGNTFAVGEIDVGPHTDVWVGEYNTAGALTWSDTFGGVPDATQDGQDRGADIVLDGDSVLYIGGNLNTSFEGDAFVRRYDRSGSTWNMTWESTFDTGFTELVNDLDVAGSSVFAVGTAFSSGGGVFGFALALATGDGAEIASTTSFFDGNQTRVTGVSATDSAVFVSGTGEDLTAFPSGADAHVLKLNPATLAVIWDEMIGTTWTGPTDPGSDEWANDLVAQGSVLYVVGLTDNDSLGDPLPGMPGTGGFFRQYRDNGSTATEELTFVLPPIESVGSASAYVTGVDPAGSGECLVTGRESMTNGDCIVARIDSQAGEEVPLGSDVFTDVQASNIFDEAIGWLADQGITKGCNPPANDEFCPDLPVDRGAMAAFMDRWLGFPEPSQDYFVDDESDIFEPHINRMAEAGVTKGCNPPDNTLFCPDDVVDRGAMAAFIDRALGLPEATQDYFVDDDNSIFQHHINNLAEAGITKGCNPPANDEFCPHLPVSREAMAAFLYRARDLPGN